MFEKKELHYNWPQFFLPLAVLAYVVAAHLLSRGSLPDPLAVHFDLGGAANGFLSWKANLILIAGAIISLALVETIIRQCWLYGSPDKFCVFAPIFGGSYALVAWGNCCVLSANLVVPPVLAWHWGIGTSLIILALFTSIGIENYRLGRFKKSQINNSIADRSIGINLQSDLKIDSNTRFCLSQASNPRWWNFALACGCLFPIVMGISCAWLSGEGVLFSTPWFMLVVVLLSLSVLIIFWGGYRFIADNQKVLICLGVFSLPIKKITLNQITDIEVIRNFAPLGTFLGYGWRINYSDKISGYCLCKGDAVKIKTSDWSYLLVMDDAATFAGVLKKASEFANKPSVQMLP